MATINNDFKVKNGLVVGTTATITNNANIGGDVSVTGTVLVQGYDLMSYDGSVHYVSDETGNDSNDGHRLISAYKSIKQALNQAASGDKVFIEAGIYYEEFPLTIPQGVSVRGAGLRAVTVYPTTATNTQTALLLNGESYISDFTLTGFYKPGYAFRFAPGAKIITRSPYIERLSVITRGSATSTGDPYGFDAGDAGNGAYLDAGILDPTSLEPAMLWNETTFIIPNATGFYMTNGARAELLNGFFYFADKAIDAQAGTSGYGGVGKTKLKLGGISGTITAGDTLFYKTSSGDTLASGTIASVDGSYVYLTGAAWGFDTVTTRTAKIISVLGNTNVDTAVKKYGTGSAKFDGTGDVLTIPSNEDFAFGTGTFTIECWVRLNTLTGTQILFDFRNDGTTPSSYAPILTSVSGTLTYQTLAGNRIVGTTLTTSTWYHVALARSGSSTKLFLDGTQVGSTYTDTNAYIQGPLTIGSQYNSSNPVNGYIDDIRISKGIARYTTSFVAPTSALVVDEYTVLMLHADGVSGSTVFTDENAVPQVIYSTGTTYATATSIELADYHQFGAELRCIGSAAVFGNSGVTANGTGTDLKLIAFNISHIGSGKDLSCDTSLTNQPNEIIQTNGGRVYYQTVDHNGDFRVGNSFLVNQRTGDVSFGDAKVNLSSLSNLVITDGSNSTTITPTGIETGNLSLGGNTLASLSGDITLDPAGTLTIINSDTDINGNVLIGTTTESVSTNSGALVVNGGAGIGGNLYVGGTMYGAFSGSLTGVASTATDLFGGLAGQVPYQTGPSQTTFAGTGTVGDVFVSQGTLGPQFQNTLTLSSSLYSTSTTSSNALYVVGGIGAGWINIANDAYINGAAVVTTATLGSATGSSSFNIQNTASNAFTVAGGAIIGGNLTIGGSVQFSGSVTSIDSTSINIGSKIIYLSTLSSTASFAYGSGIIIGTDPDVSTSTVTWASLTFDGGIPGNWVMSNGLLPKLNTLYDLGSDVFKWSTVYASTVTATQIYDNNKRVVTDVTPSSGTAIGIGNLISTGPNASFTINNLGVTSAAGSTYIGVSTSTGSISITNLGVTNLSSGSDITLSATTGSITINDVSTLQSVTNRGSTSNNVITITNTTVSTGTTTGALTVAGGVGIQGSLYAGNMYSNGNQVLTSGGAGGGYVSSVSAGTDISVNTTTGEVIVSNISTLQSVTSRGATTTNIIFIATSTNASSTNSGALQVVGGVGIGGALYVNGTSYIDSSQIITTATVNQYANQTSIFAGTDTAVNTSTGAITIWNTSTLQSITSRGATSNNPINLTNTLSVSSQTTLGAVTATSIVVNGTVQHTGLVLTDGLNVDQIYNTSTVITLTTEWQDTGVDSSELATGSYMVQCTANDQGVGGNEVNTYYTGIMSWWSGGDIENSYDEITLHRAGAASGSGSIFLQVLRTLGGYMKLQIAGTVNNPSPSTYALKFRRMI